MSDIAKRNNEGYSDPTAYQALVQIERYEKITRIDRRVIKRPAFMPIVYVCSPYSGNVKRNTEKARRFSRFVVKMGGIPFAPHLLFPQFLSDEKSDERELAMFMNSIMLTKCNELWVFGSLITEGMGFEIEKARSRGMNIRFFTNRCEEVFV